MFKDIWKLLAVLFFAIGLIEFIWGYSKIKDLESSSTIKIKELEMRLEQVKKDTVVPINADKIFADSIMKMLEFERESTESNFFKAFGDQAEYWCDAYEKGWTKDGKSWWYDVDNDKWFSPGKQQKPSNEECKE